MAPHDDKQTIIVAISGPSSSGKTTVTKNLLGLVDCQILHQDDFYVPDDQIPLDPVTKEQNWDLPEAVDFEKFIRHIKTIKAGNKTEKIRSLEMEVDLKLSDSAIDSLKAKLSHKLKNYRIVLVDGFMLFHDENIIDLFDIKLFYYSNHDVLKTRRSKRTGYSTVAGFWVDPPNYFDEYVWPAYQTYHKHLFANDDVNSTLNDHAVKDLGIKDFKNDDDSTVDKMVSWTLDQIVDYIDKL